MEQEERASGQTNSLPLLIASWIRRLAAVEAGRGEWSWIVGESDLIMRPGTLISRFYSLRRPENRYGLDESVQVN
jgi:hypothetical protein